MNLDRYLPEHTTDDAIAAMSQYAVKEHTEAHVQDLAQELTAEIHPDDKVSQMAAIMNWIRVNLTYVLDEKEGARLFGTKGDLELVKSPIAVLESKRYDCDCIATFIASLCLALGIQVQFVTVGFTPEHITGPDGFDHVYAEGFDPVTGSWLVLDPVAHPNEAQMTMDTAQKRTWNVG